MNIVLRLRQEIQNKSALNEKFFNLLISFLIYSFTGWLAETIYMSFYHGHMVKRGYLIGPLCVVYGFGSLLVVHILNHIKAHPLLLFVSSAAITTFVELLAGILLWKLGSKKLWDYSGDFCNFMGYICLRNTIMWGVLSLFLVYIINPAVVKLVCSIPSRTKELICYSAIICLSLDIGISIYSSLKGVNNLVFISQVFFYRMP